MTNTEGSWLAGKDGAYPGIIMPAKPTPDGPYRQEYLAGEAEDMAKVIKLDGTISNSYGDFTDVLVTEEWSDLEPDVLERKYYVSGIGMISSEIIKGGDEHFDLTTFEQGAGTPEATPGYESGNRDLRGGRGGIVPAALCFATGSETELRKNGISRLNRHEMRAAALLE